jgi:hypothetical protein
MSEKFDDECRGERLVDSKYSIDPYNLNKHFKVSRPCDLWLPQNDSLLLSSGCCWSQENWSCSYDCVFMILFHAYWQGCLLWRDSWCQDANGLSVLLSQSFDSLQCDLPIFSQDRFDQSRDKLQDNLSALNLSCFPHTGMVGASIVAVLEYILPSYQATLGAIAYCTNMHCAELTHSISADLNFDIPAICSPLWGLIEQDAALA